MKRAPLFSLIASLLLIGCTGTANPDAGHPSVTPRGDGSAGTTSPVDGSDSSLSSNGGKGGSAGSAGTTDAGRSTDAAGSTGTAGSTGAGGAAGSKGGEGGSRGGEGGGRGGEGGSKGGAGGSGGATGGSRGGGVLEMLTTFRMFDVVETAAGPIFGSDGSRILQVSTDNGATWKPVPGASSFATHPSALVENALGEVLAGTIAALPAVYYCTPTGCKAASGVTGAAGAMTKFTRDSGGSVYAINDNSAVLHHSTDHGHTWTAINASLPATIGQAYAVEANAYGLMMGGEIGSLLRSTDGGMNWTDFGLLRHSQRLPTDYHGNLWAIATDPVTKTVLATVGDPDIPGAGAIQRHLPTDAAAVWHGANGLKGSGGEDFSGFVFQKDGSILAGAILQTPDTGEVYKSTDGGASWVDISSKIGVPLSGLTRLHLGPSGCLYISHRNGLIRNCAGY
jgi:photosystem II stability/assembly factor-like uncharacterized protein